jgi:hypothetical protein
LASVTLPLAGEPALAIVFPPDTTSFAKVASNVCPALAVPELSSDPVRTVIRVPDGMLCPTAKIEIARIVAAVFSARLSMVPPQKMMVLKAPDRFGCRYLKLETLLSSLQL